MKNGYHPNGDKRLTVYQHKNSKEKRKDWEKRMDKKYKPKVRL